MKKYLFILLIVQVILSWIIEYVMQTYRHIIGIGIITMLYFIICDIHDMFLTEDGIKNKTKNKTRT